MQEMSGHPEGYSHTVGMGKKHLIKCNNDKYQELSLGRKQQCMDTGWDLIRGFSAGKDP